MADPYKYESSYDLVNKYDWTSVPPNSPLRNEAPAAYVTAYQLQYSQLRSFIDGYLNVLGVNTPKGTKSATPGLDFYRRLYGTSSDPLARFSFPFFSDNIRSFSTEFADTFSPISQRGAQMLGGEFLQGLGGAGESVVGGAAALASGIANIGAAAENTGDKSVIDKVSKAAIQGTSNVFNKAFGTDINFNSGLQTIGAPGTYIETPKFYQYSNTDNGLELSFALSNTLNDYAREQNHKFIKDFTRMNRPFRTGPIGMTFPAIYNIVVPGQRYIMWAYLEDFSVGLLGNRRRVKLEGENGGSRIVPEAYTCQFNFRSLTIEAANFMDEIDKFGSFAGDDDSYSKLKAEEEKIMGDAKARADRAARERQRRNKIDRKTSSGGFKNWQNFDIDPRTGKPVGMVDIHGTHYGSAWHRNKYPEQYGPNKMDYYELGKQTNNPENASRIESFLKGEGYSEPTNIPDPTSPAEEQGAGNAGGAPWLRPGWVIPGQGGEVLTMEQQEAIQGAMDEHPGLGKAGPEATEDFLNFIQGLSEND